MKNIFVALTLCATASLCAQESTIENKWNGNRPDAHAPISIMGDHTHGKGEFMLSYRYMYMDMHDLKRGSDDASFISALKPNDKYMVTPTRMPMHMHMLGLMFAPTNRVTLMAMGMYSESSMKHLTVMGANFTTASNGWGDVQVSALYKFLEAGTTKMHLQAGISLPTGSIDEKGVTPMSMGMKMVMPYAMQIGSGTYDGLLGLTFLQQWQATSFGAQAKSTIRFGENDNSYTLGNNYRLNSWYSYKATDVMSLSLHAEGVIVDEIAGSNPALNPMMVSTADTQNSGGTYVNLGLGANFFVPKGCLKDLRFSVELAYPLYQDLNGVQLKAQEVFTTGVQYAF
tara:strand:- start:35907 stop:36932 length:1026 start_codon:yes stop_codon:yes gene_type:complete